MVHLFPRKQKIRKFYEFIYDFTPFTDEEIASVERIVHNESELLDELEVSDDPFLYQLWLVQPHFKVKSGKIKMFCKTKPLNDIEFYGFVFHVDSEQ